MSATTTQTIRLIDCPACRELVSAELTYDVKLNPSAYAEGAPIDPIDKTATATLTLIGVQINHACPRPTSGGGYHPRSSGGFIPPAHPTDGPLARKD